MSRLSSGRQQGASPERGLEPGADRAPHHPPTTRYHAWAIWHGPSSHLRGKIEGIFRSRRQRDCLQRAPWPAALAVATLLAACGSSGVPPGASPTTTPGTSQPSTIPTTTGPVALRCGVVARPDIVITDSTQPCSVSTHVGATFHIVLDPGFNWGAPSSDSSAVEVGNVQRQSSGRLDADVHALRIGRATVSAAGSVLCAPGQPCPALARLWALHITVGATSAGTTR